MLVFLFNSALLSLFILVLYNLVLIEALLLSLFLDLFAFEGGLAGSIITVLDSIIDFEVILFALLFLEFLVLVIDLLLSFVSALVSFVTFSFMAVLFTLEAVAAVIELGSFELIFLEFLVFALIIDLLASS